MVLLTVFGAPKIFAGDKQLRTGLRSSARELLLWLALHPDGGAGPRIIADLWSSQPVDDHRKRDRFRNATHNARETLAVASGRTEGWFINHDRGAGLYRLIDEEVHNEWAVFESLLAQARAAEATADATGARLALDATVGLCRGPLADGVESAWLVPLRQHALRHALDALCRLAALVESDNPDQAVDYLRRAIDLDPYAEACYQALMRLHAQQGHHEEVRSLLQQLDTQLADLGAEPDQETIILAGQLLARQHPAAAGSPPSATAAQPPDATTGRPPNTKRAPSLRGDRPTRR